MNRTRSQTTRSDRLLLLLLAGVSSAVYAQKTTITIQASGPGKPISPDLFGIFFEDLNYAADGGLYAELIQNRSFEYSPTEQPAWNPLSFWELQKRGGGDGSDQRGRNAAHPREQSALRLADRAQPRRRRGHRQRRLRRHPAQGRRNLRGFVLGLSGFHGTNVGAGRQQQAHARDPAAGNQGRRSAGRSFHAGGGSRVAEGQRRS